MVCILDPCVDSLALAIAHKAGAGDAEPQQDAKGKTVCDPVVVAAAFSDGGASFVVAARGSVVAVESHSVVLDLQQRSEHGARSRFAAAAHPPL